MRKTLIIFLMLALCAGTLFAVLAGPTARPDVALASPDPHTRVFTETYLKSMPTFSGHYTLTKSSSPYTYFEQDWKGVDLSYLLETEVGLAPGTTGIKIQADDGFGRSHTLDEMRGNSNPRGLKTLLAYMYATASADNPHAPDPVGAPWVAPLTPDTLVSNADGPFRSVLPQTIEGPSSSNTAYSPPGTGTAGNWSKSVKLVRAIEVLPLPAGMTELSAAELGALPDDQILVYGNIQPQSITDVSPQVGIAGTEVTITGYGFGTTQGTSYVNFGGVQATSYTSWGPQEIKCRVPAEATGNVQVTAMVPNGVTNAVPFIVFSKMYTETALKAMTQSGGHYTSQNAATTYREQDWLGVDLQWLLETDVGIPATATGIKIQGGDSYYAADLTMAQMRGNSNPRGLKTLLGYLSGTRITNPLALNGLMDGTGGFPSVAPVTPTTYDTGPFRSVMPQAVEGPGSTNINYNPLGSGDSNASAWVQNVRAVEVKPLPAGISELTGPEVDALPDNQVLVYGYIFPDLTITSSATAGGTITPLGATTVPFGGSQHYDIAASTGYHITDVEVDSSSVGAVTTYDFTDVTANHTIDAFFEINNYTIAVSADPTEGGTVSGGGGFDYGTPVNLQATPNPGWYFVNWTEGGAEVSTNADYSFTAEADRTLVANFKPYAEITNAAPTAGKTNTLVTITGVGFGDTQGTSFVSFGSVNAAYIESWSDTQVVCKVPPGSAGLVNLTLTTDKGTSNAVPFSVLPFISKVAPKSGVAWTVVTVSGSGFGDTKGTSFVRFGGVQVTSYVSWSNNEIVCKVPAAAYGSINVAVETTGGRSNLMPFKVVPRVTRFSPMSGAPGTVVTLTGNGFGDRRKTSTVTFGNTPVTQYVSWSNNQIKVKVPAMAAGPTLIKVTTPGGTSVGAVFTVK
ncbi:MAG: IPT/TIG domain-containing protein [Actinomycetota bacterium]